MYRYNRHVWQSQGLSSSERLLLLCLLDHANEDGVCWPSLSTLSRETGYTKRGVEKILDRLRQRGLVSWRILPETGGRTYRVHLEALANLTQGEPGSPGGRTTFTGGANVVRGGGEPGSPGEANDVHRGDEPRSPGGRTSFVGGANVVRGGGERRSTEPPIELPIEPPTTTPPFIPPKTGEPNPDPLEAAPTLPPTGEPTPDPLEAVGGEVSREDQGHPQETAKTEGAHLPALSREAGQRALEVSPAARDDAHKPAPGVAEVPTRYRPPDPHTEAGARAVRALREAGLWERFSSLRRHARDWPAWQEWLHGPIARHYTRLGEAAFVQAVGEALEGLASRPDLSRPLLWFERQLQKAAPPPPPLPLEPLEAPEAAPGGGPDRGKGGEEVLTEDWLDYIGSVLGWDQDQDREKRLN